MRAHHSSRGEVSAESASVFGAMMMLVFFVVAVASHAIAAHVASVAALQGARSASVQSGNSHDIFVAAAERVETVVHELGSHLTRPPRLDLVGRNVRVVVSVRTITPFGLLPREVTRSAMVPVEQYLREVDR